MAITRNTIGVLAASGILALGVAACGSSGKKPATNASSTTGSGGSYTANGAGSTFAAPIYQQFGNALKSQGTTIDYNPVGSGDGVAELIAGTTDFAGTDPPLKDSEVKQAERKGTPVHFPIAFGAITVSYNLSGVGTGLKLDGPTLAKIFLGKVKTWNDPAITGSNPGVKLPSTPITVVHRSDSSGTTKGFTGFLAAVDPAWKSQVGSDKTVKWPTGTGAKGNDGVAAAIKQTPGAVGYVEQAYALQSGFTTADVKNAAGRYVAPSLQAATAAAEGLSVPPDLRFAISNPANPQAYPITSQTFIVVYRDMCRAGITPSAAHGVHNLLAYALGAGQDVLSQLKYARLPSSLDAKAKAQLPTLTCNGAKLG